MGSFLELPAVHLPIAIAVVGLTALLIASVTRRLLAARARLQGQLGAWRLARRELSALDPTAYQVLHDVALPRLDGNGWVRLEHLVASRRGLFVVLVDGCPGAIAGEPNARQWIRHHRGQGERFDNPLRCAHQAATLLAAHLELPLETVHPLVVFTAPVTFPRGCPPGVLVGGCREAIETQTREPLSRAELAHALRLLGGFRLHADEAVARQRRPLTRRLLAEA